MALWDGVFTGRFTCEAASAYVSRSSGLSDARPVTVQNLDWRFTPGDWGFFDGYIWTISSLHDMQHHSHRPLFYDVETVVRYGYKFDFGRDLSLVSVAGPYVDFPFGYRNAHMKCWGWYATQDLKTPWLTLYWKGLWIVETTRRARIAAGISHSFKLAPDLTLSPFVETVWMDHRRFRRRYGNDLDSPDFASGAFSTFRAAAALKWRKTENLSFVFTAGFISVVNPEARRAERRRHAYSAKCDWPYVKAGIEYSF